MKKLTVRQVAQLKRTAQNVYPLVNKKNKLMEQIASMNAELENVQAQIDAWEGATKAMTGGYTSEDLITRNVICATNEDGTTKVDKNGQPIKVTKYEPKAGVLVLNEEDNTYEIVEMVEPTNEIPDVDGESKVYETIIPNAFPTMGNDFDKDAETLNL